MVILLTSILATVSIITIDKGISDVQFDETVTEMEMLRQALVGDLDVKDGGIRSSFGYLGDVGSLPTNAQGLNALTVNPALPAWTVNATSRFALGWNGPYMSGNAAVADFTKDAWNRAYIIDFVASPATITSRGADGAAGGTGFNQDIVVQIPATLQRAAVHGFISQSGSPYAGAAEIDLYRPTAGALTTSTTTILAAANGYFTFANVPLGRRSVKIYIPSKAAPTQTLGPLVFTVDNSNFVIPTNSSDLGGGGGTPPPSCSAGKITYVAGSAAAVGGGSKNVTFNINIVANISVVSVVVTYTVATATYSRTSFDGVVRICTGGGLAPCPAITADIVTLTPAAALVTGASRPAQIDFSRNMSGAGAVTVKFNYATGCDQLALTVP